MEQSVSTNQTQDASVLTTKSMCTYKPGNVLMSAERSEANIEEIRSIYV